MKLSYRLWAVMLLVMAGMSSWAQVPAEVRDAAAKGLGGYLASIPAESSAAYGFSDRDTRGNASLGEPFLLHAIAPRDLARANSDTTVKSLINPTTMWYFPVIQGGVCRAILVVDRSPDGWEAVSFGYAPLAREIDHVMRRHVAVRPTLITIFQDGRYFFTVPGAGSGNLTPIRDGVAKDRASYENLSTLAALLPTIKMRVARSTEEHQ